MLLSYLDMQTENQDTANQARDNFQAITAQPAIDQLQVKDKGLFVKAFQKRPFIMVSLILTLLFFFITVIWIVYPQFVRFDRKIHHQ
ncbi:MAG: hypothetical protein UT04_C0083G0001, partial [Candidatus Daviesbacteria bacterium GW2011_GWF2_38_7]